MYFVSINQGRVTPLQFKVGALEVSVTGDSYVQDGELYKTLRISAAIYDGETCLNEFAICDFEDLLEVVRIAGHLDRGEMYQTTLRSIYVYSPH